MATTTTDLDTKPSETKKTTWPYNLNFYFDATDMTGNRDNASRKYVSTELFAQADLKLRVVYILNSN